MITFKRTRRKIKRQYYWWKYLRLPIGKKVYLIGTPDHSNIGDSAIAVAEIKFLVQRCPKLCVKEITYDEIENNRAIIKRIIPQGSIIIGHGGGNIGNLWYAMEQNRQHMIVDYFQNPIIIMPQTAFFTDDIKGESIKKKTSSVYGNHSKLTITARDQQTFELLQKMNSRLNVLLCPDIVLSTKKSDYDIEKSKRDGVLFVFRNDREKSLKNSEIEILKQILDEMKIKIDFSDMISEVPIFKENRKEIVENKLSEFSKYNLVITDRLHGMVFSAISETPCIVLDNNHYKVRGTYTWISKLPYIQFANNIDEAINLIPELMARKECIYDNSPLLPYYNELERKIKKYL